MGPFQQGHLPQKSRKMGNGQKLDLALKIYLLVFKSTQLVISVTKKNQPMDLSLSENYR